MKNSDFDTDSVLFGVFLGSIAGIIFTVLAMHFGIEKQIQTECKELDGVQICRDVYYFPWKVKEADK